MPYEDIIRVVELYSAEEVNEYLSKPDEDWVILCIIDGRRSPDKPAFGYCLGLIAPLGDTSHEEWA